jgi:hypothetical protein
LPAAAYMFASNTKSEAFPWSKWRTCFALQCVLPSPHHYEFCMDWERPSTQLQVVHNTFFIISSASLQVPKTTKKINHARHNTPLLQQYCKLKPWTQK